MTNLEKKALLDVLSWLESQKKFTEDCLIEDGFSYLLKADPIDFISKEYYVGSLNAYRSCLLVLKSYFC